jgi:hypothetical protein
MLNKKGMRELAYVVEINDITPIPGYDRVELAHISGWTVVVGKGEFHIGDPAIYFEIDSQLPEVAPFTNMEFLAKKHYKIKTQKMCKSLSQGLLMSAANFGWTMADGAILDLDGNRHSINDESRFLTAQLGVTYAEPGDNKRKATSVDKYKKMAQRNGKLFKHQPFRWLMKREWGRKILFVFFGRKRDKKSSWPSWVSKTDEERVENIPSVLMDKTEWIATEKLDGTSTTATVRRGKFGKFDYYICSRNVVFDKPGKNCFYEKNVYTMMSEKYQFEKVLIDLCKKYNLEWATLQGETFGGTNPLIQKNTYDMKACDFRGFNLIFSDRGRLNSVEAAKIMAEYGIKWVPILDEHYVLPDTIDELRAYVNSQPSTINGKIKEGIVFRYQDGSKSFKCVSPEYLLKYHQ